MAEMKRAETGVMVPPEDRAPLTFFKDIVFKLRDKGAMAGDNTVRQRIGELTDDLHGRGDFFIAHAKEYLRCFQPVTGVKFTNTTDVPTLFDQLKPTLEQFNKDRQREVLEYLVHDVTRSIVKKEQPRPTKTGRLFITDRTRGEASGFLETLEDVIMEKLEPTPVAGQTQYDRFIKVPVRASESALTIYLALRLGACTTIQPTISPDITPSAITQTVPAIETPSPTEFQPTPTDIYHFGSGGPINQEMLNQMEREDLTVAKQITWLNQWAQWYDSADPSIRPMTANEAKNSIVFYKWAGADGSTHYKAAWKLDRGYPGFILEPPAINWENFNPPVTSTANHEIGPGQGPVKVSTQCLEGSDLAKMGVPVGAQLTAEAGTGDWVMVYKDNVVARVDKGGVWEGILGGSEVAYLYDGRRIPMPEEVKALLIPSSPDTWKQTGWLFADGTPYLWGEPIVVGSEDQRLVVMPSFVRGVVEIPEPLGHAGGKRIFVVLEVPAHGGSNFIILNFQDNKYATNPTVGRNYLVDGKVPLNWANSSWENPISYEDYSPGSTFSGIFTDKQTADEFKNHTGQMVMVSFQTAPGDVASLALQQVVEGTLINQNGQSGVDEINPPVSLTLP